MQIFFNILYTENRYLFATQSISVHHTVLMTNSNFSSYKLPGPCNEDKHNVSVIYPNVVILINFDYRKFPKH